MEKRGVVVPGQTPPANSSGVSDIVKEAGVERGEAWDSSAEEKTSELECKDESSQSGGNSESKP